MSFRSRRVVLSAPFYMLFEFFLLKYIFLLVGGIDEVILAAISILIGLNHVVPMFFEARKSTRLFRFLTTFDGIWMWASLMFLIDILIIYLIGSFVDIPKSIILVLLAIVPILGIYNYHNAHKLVVNEKTLKLDNWKKKVFALKIFGRDFFS